MSRNDAFEEGQAQRAADPTSSSPLNDPHYHPKKASDEKFTTHLMMGDHPSGATSVTMEDMFPKSGMQTIRMYKGKQNIGILDVSGNKIHHIETQEDSKRKGVAKTMYRLANFAAGRGGAEGPVSHGDIRTPSGDSWAKSVGGELPTRIPAFGINRSLLEHRK